MRLTLLAGFASAAGTAIATTIVAICTRKVLTRMDHHASEVLTHMDRHASEIVSLGVSRALAETTLTTRGTCRSPRLTPVE